MKCLTPPRELLDISQDHHSSPFKVENGIITNKGFTKWGKRVCLYTKNMF